VATLSPADAAARRFHRHRRVVYVHPVAKQGGQAVLSWNSTAVSSFLDSALLLGWLWMVVAYLRAPHNLRRLWSYGGDPLHESLRWRGLVVFGVSLMCVSYNFVMAANSGTWPPGDYRNGDWWILANQALVVLVGPALVAAGVAAWMKRRGSSVR
jgi:hypothetical protein